jgi:sigma-B regulation protein RsbU (phosphoserine phosphatase)
MPRKTKKQIARDEPRSIVNERLMLRGEQIYQLTTLVAGELSLQEVLDKLAEAAVKIVGVKACSIRLLNEQTNDLKMRSTYGLSEEYRNKGPVTKDDTVVKAAFAGQAVVLDDMRIDRRVKYKEATIKEGLVSQLTVVMQFRNKPIGVLRLYSPKPKNFDEDDINLARAVASQCAVAIINAKLYAEKIEGARAAEQMRLAGFVQRKMIPQTAPQIKGLDIAATYIPCFDVGGDFYDFLQITDDCVAVAIADVIGKGIPAALMMSLFRGALWAYMDTEYGEDNIRLNPGERFSDNKLLERDMECAANIFWSQGAIHKLNKMACKECGDGEFITLFYAVIDAKEQIISYCNCGHEPAVLIRNGRIMDLEKGGLVLGVDEKAKYEIETVELKDGDSLLFYTDGLIDAANFDGQLWGKEQLIRTAKKYADGSAQQMLKNILRYRRRFVGLAEQIDDTSIIVVKVDTDEHRQKH